MQVESFICPDSFPAASTYRMQLAAPQCRRLFPAAPLALPSRIPAPSPSCLGLHSQLRLPITLPPPSPASAQPFLPLQELHGQLPERVHRVHGHGQVAVAAHGDEVVGQHGPDAAPHQPGSSGCGWDLAVRGEREMGDNTSKLETRHLLVQHGDEAIGQHGPDPAPQQLARARARAGALIENECPGGAAPDKFHHGPRNRS